MTPDSTNRPTAGTFIRRAHARTSTRHRLGAALGFAALAAGIALGLPARADARLATSVLPDSMSVVASLAASARTTDSRNDAILPLVDSLRGHSRKLRARFLAPKQAVGLPVLRALFGDSSVSRAGIYSAIDTGSSPFHFITMRPFSDKVGGRIGSYRIGSFPQEARGARSAAYVNPDGFLEVTSQNQHTLISENFRLADFLTHDQVRVWPKYLVLREPLIDKLELVIAELKEMGIPVNRMKVMSGFRTPQYNAPGVGAGGRAKDSRHQYGDAADVYIVNGAKDWMSDINRDGKVNTADARTLAMAAERVERENPDLVGGIGIYPATSAHGPFVHIDVRGTRARWGH